MVKTYPKYAIIKDHLMQGIATSTFIDALPSENQLARKFGVSRMTARKALTEVEKEGFAERIPGKGTFVKKRRFNQGFFRVRAIRNQAAEMGVVPVTKVLETRLVDLPPHLTDILPNNKQVLKVRRLHHFDDKPVQYEVVYLRGDLCGGLLWEDLSREPVHEILVAKMKLPLTSVWQKMEARILPPDLAVHFNVSPGHPAFYINRITYTFEDPVTWVEYYILGEVAFEETFSPQAEPESFF